MAEGGGRRKGAGRSSDPIVDGGYDGDESIISVGQESNFSAAPDFGASDRGAPTERGERGESGDFGVPPAGKKKKSKFGVSALLKRKGSNRNIFSPAKGGDAAGAGAATGGTKTSGGAERASTGGKQSSYQRMSDDEEEGGWQGESAAEAAGGEGGRRRSAKARIRELEEALQRQRAEDDQVEYAEMPYGEAVRYGSKSSRAGSRGSASTHFNPHEGRGGGDDKEEEDEDEDDDEDEDEDLSVHMDMYQDQQQHDMFDDSLSALGILTTDGGSQSVSHAGGGGESEGESLVSGYGSSHGVGVVEMVPVVPPKAAGTHSSGSNVPASIRELQRRLSSSTNSLQKKLTNSRRSSSNGNHGQGQGQGQGQGHDQGQGQGQTDSEPASPEGSSVRDKSRGGKGRRSSRRSSRASRSRSPSIESEVMHTRRVRRHSRGDGSGHRQSSPGGSFSDLQGRQGRSEEKSERRARSRSRSSHTDGGGGYRSSSVSSRSRKGWVALEEGNGGGVNNQAGAGGGSVGGANSMAENVGVDKRRFTRWKGNNRFFCGGRLMLGVHWRQLFLSIFMMTTTWGLFFLIVYPDIAEWPYAAVPAVLIVGTFVTLFLSSAKDPGIIPRRPFNRLVESMPPDVKDKLNYCSTCHILRPPRAKHCRHCNNCVLRFDHHCPWTGNCVGRRNYRPFFVFILLVLASSSYVLGLSVLHIMTKIGKKGPAGLTDGEGLIKGSKYAVPLLATWTLLITLLVGAMVGFHVFLLCKGQTTNEFLRGEHRRGDEPHKPFLANCADLWCEAVPDSMLPPMHHVPDESDRRADAAYATELATAMKEQVEDTNNRGRNMV